MNRVSDPKIKKETDHIMGGQVLEYEAKTIRLNTIIDFVKSGICSIEVGAEKAGMSVVEFEKMMNTKLGAI